MIKETLGCHSNPFMKGLNEKQLNAIRSSIQRQIKLERNLSFDNQGHAPLKETDKFVLGFNLNSRAAQLGAKSLALLNMLLGNELEGALVIDVGGANDQLLRILAQKSEERFNGIFTSLFYSERQASDLGFSQYELAIEEPPSHFYRKFDLVTSVNGPLIWSQFPELAIKNLIDLVRPGGSLFLGIHRNLYFKDFSPIQSMSKSKRIGGMTPHLINLPKGGGTLQFVFANIK